MSLRSVAAGALKALSRMVFGRESPWWGRRLPRSSRNYSRDVGDGMSSSVIVAPVMWIARTYPEAPLCVERRGEIVPDHPMAELIRNPNPYYSGHVLQMATLIDVVLNGNGYGLKVRNRMRRPIQLWYAPSWLMKPCAPEDGSVYISHYTYSPLGVPLRVEVEDVVHLRYGLDPHNVRLGLGQLTPLLREVFTDDEAAAFTATILRNAGVPGIVVSPGEVGASVTEQDKKDTKEYFKSAFGGESRGEPLVMTGPTKVEQFGFSPQQLDLAKLREIPEERVCAVLGIPAAVVGFGSGLAQTKVGAPQPLSARLWTPHGPSTMGAVVSGDTIAIPGGWGEVRHVYPQGEQDIYRLTFQDGSTAESTLDHLWDVCTPNLGREVLPLSEIATWPAWKLKRASVPLQGVTEFAERPLLIPPYVLGLLLADGTFRGNLCFSSIDQEIIGTIREEVGAGYAVTKTATQGCDYRISYRDYRAGRGKGGGAGGRNPFISELRRLGLWMVGSPEKFLPDDYKYNSSSVRRQLLQGLLDGDGYVNLHGQPAIEQTSERLARDITEVVQSLGGYTLTSRKIADKRIRYIKGRPMASRYDRVHLSIVMDDAASLFCCSAKRDRCRARTKTPTRKFRSIQFVRREQAQCIEVDGGLYLTDCFIVTHNTMAEMREMAYESCIIPLQRLISADLDRQLLPDFETDSTARTVYDLSDVRVLQEDQNRLAMRLDTMVRGGWILVSEARREMRFEVKPEHEIYLRSFSSIVVPAGRSPEEQESGAEPTPAEAPPPAEGKARVPVKASSRERQAYAIRQLREARKLTGTFSGELTAQFRSLGEQAAQLWADALADTFPGAKAAGFKELTSEQVQLLVQSVMGSLDLSGFDFGPHYIRVAVSTFEGLNTAFGTGFNLSEPLEATLIREGGRRLGLVDMSQQATESLMDAIAEGRSLGHGPGELALDIRDTIPRGPWSSPDIRAEVIARTETKHAQNYASLEAYKASDTITMIEIVDGQISTSCEPCRARDGQVVTFEEAERIMAEEHPNGTLSLTPVIGERR